ncbi:hypothetical protein [Streptomyces sp. NPDC001843]|uniref:hypothetical protein n=1 Tax=Streptomyces sp. NPDC001843 TaxID=3364617 RepID=UPI00367F36B0
MEHLADQRQALRTLRRLVRPGGTPTVIEGDHGAVFFHPDSAYARARRHRLPGPVAVRRGRRRAARARPAPAADVRRLRAGDGPSAHRVRRQLTARAGGRIHPEHLHGRGRFRT